ncbi:MAG TPA: DUF1697 domain-containing protein [Terriglobales bacterium]|nr:DUF1697 domain-containing protein [Terriglobales bacterium]
MTAYICMLRGVNVGGHNKIKMDALRALFASLRLRDPQTYIQSGNVAFLSDERDLVLLGKHIETAIGKKFGFRPGVVLRTSNDLRRVIAKNPFATRHELDPAKLLVVFLPADPSKDAPQVILAKNRGPEEIHLHGRELYIYFPEGIARSKLTPAALDKALGTPGTGRNWNSVTKLLQMAEGLRSNW